MHTITATAAAGRERERERKDKKGLKENRIEEDYRIATNDRKASGEEGEQEVPRVHGPPTHSGLGNICSGVGRD